MNVNYLYDVKKKKGFQLVITDDTKNQKYMRLMENYNRKLEVNVEEKVGLYTDLLG